MEKEQRKEEDESPKEEKKGRYLLPVWVAEKIFGYFHIKTLSSDISH